MATLPARKIGQGILIAFIFGLILSFAPGFTLAQEDEYHFTILHTNDEHSALVPYLDPDQPQHTVGGFARLATAVATLRQEKEASDEPVLLFSGGDFLGETAYGWLAPWGYAAEISLMQQIGYDAIAIGNHEYDFGPDVLADYLMTAGYPQAHAQTTLLAANTRPPADHPLAREELLQSSRIIDLHAGPRLGIFGLIGIDAVSVTADPGDIEFLDQVETAQAMVAELKEQGADLIIAITHSGDDEDVELVEQVDGIDLIIGGHSHTYLEEPLEHGDTLIAQTGSQAQHLGVLELAYQPQTKTLRLRNKQTGQPFSELLDDRYPPHPQIVESIDYYTDTMNERLAEMTGGLFDDMHASLVRSDFTLRNEPRFSETAVANFITDGMRQTTEAVTGKPVHLAVQANGSIRGSLVPWTIDGRQNELPFYDITNVIGLGYGQDGYPGYSIASLYLTGEEVRRVLEVTVLLPELMGNDYFLQLSGIRYEYNPQNTILLTVPFIDQPIPSTRAITAAHFYRGEGIQPPDLAESDDFVPIKRGDETLYHMVTDTYILSFLPMAGELLPQLEIVPKNADGIPVPFERFDELTVPYQGRQLKVWETVAMYAASLPPGDDASVARTSCAIIAASLSPGDDGMPQMPQNYTNAAARIHEARSFPLIAWLWIALILLLAAISLLIYFLRRRRQRRRAKKAT